MSTTAAPKIWFAGDAYTFTPTVPATDGLTELKNLLLSGAFAATGATVLHIDAGELSQAYTGQPDAATVAYYQSVLSVIAQYCNQHGITVAVETDGFSSDWNYQWIQAAQTANLPVAAIEDDSEAPLYGILTGTPTADFNYTSSASPDIQNEALTTLPAATAGAVATLVQSYAGGFAQLLAAYPHAQFGVWNGMFVGEQGTYDLLTQNYFQQLQALVNGLAGGTDARPVYVLEEANWSATPADTAWQPAFQAFSTAMQAIGVPQILNVDIPQSLQGTPAALQQTNALLEDRLARVAADPSITLAGLNIDFGNLGGIAAPDAPLADPESVANLSAMAAAVYPLYHSGLLTYAGSLHISGGTMAIGQAGVAVAEPLSLTAAAAGAGDIAVVVLDQTGALSATEVGAATVTGAGTEKIVLIGDATDVAAELQSLTVTDASAAPDVLNAQAFGAAGLLSDYVGLLQGASTVSAADATLATPADASTSLAMQGGGNAIYLNGVADTLTGSTAAETVYAGTGDVIYANGGAADDFFGGSGAVTINTGSGGGSYATGAQASLVISGAGPAIVSESGVGTADTIEGGGNSIYFTNGSNTFYTNAALAGTPTLIGGSGADTVFGNADPGIYFFSSPASRFFAGTGAATVIGCGELFGGAAATELVASAANTTLVGGAGTTLMFGAQDSRFVVGAGQTTVAGGSGAQTLFTGSAQLTAFLGSGSATVLLQGGSGAIRTGGGPDSFYVNIGGSGGNYSLDGFRPGEDTLAVAGAPGGVLAQAEASQTDIAGASALALPDGTKITFVGLSSLPTASIF